MKRASLAILTFAITVTACQESVTSPQIGAEARFDRFSNPPPPPVETEALVSFGEGSEQFFLTRSFAIQSEHCDGLQPTDIIIPVTYMYDPTGNTGYLHFSSRPADSLTADANGMVKMRLDKNGDQTFEGKGTVEMIIDGCPLVIFLESVTDDSHFGACPTENEVPELAANEPRDEASCFFVEFSRVELDEEDVGGAQMSPSPFSCEDNPEPPAACDPFLFNPDVVD